VPVIDKQDIFTFYISSLFDAMFISETGSRGRQCKIAHCKIHNLLATKPNTEIEARSIRYAG
jgi:hypothetical protein